MTIILRSLVPLHRASVAFYCSTFPSSRQLSIQNQSFSQMEPLPKLLVTRMESEIPKPAIEMLQKQFSTKYIFGMAAMPFPCNAPGCFILLAYAIPLNVPLNFIL